VAAWSCRLGRALIVNAATRFELIDAGDLRLTPLAFTVTGVLFGWALFRQRLLDLVPVAGERVIDTMGDGVVVVGVHASWRPA
jgi:hypothetical protein